MDQDQRRSLQPVTELPSEHATRSERHNISVLAPNGLHRNRSKSERYSLSVRTQATDNHMSKVYSSYDPSRPQSVGFEAFVQPNFSTSIDSSNRESSQAYVNRTTSYENIPTSHGSERRSVFPPPKQLPKDPEAPLVENFKHSTVNRYPSKSCQGNRMNIDGQQNGRSQSIGPIISFEGVRRASVLREQIVLNAKTRRAREGRGIVMGSSSILPSMSPLPTKLPNSLPNRKPSIPRLPMRQGQTNSIHSAFGGAERKTGDYSFYEPHVNKMNDSPYPQLLRRTKDHSTSVAADPARTPSRTLYQPRSLSQISSRPSSTPPPMPTSSASYMNPKSQLTNPLPRSRSQVLAKEYSWHTTPPPQDSIVRPLSVHSIASIVSSKSNVSRQSRQSHQSSRTSRSEPTRKSRGPHKTMSQEQMDALAALTARAPTPNGRMTPKSLALLQSQQQLLDDRIRRESVASERALRISMIREQRKLGAALQTKAGLSQQSLDIKGDHTRPISSGGDGNSNEREVSLTPESIRLLREKEKLVRWKAERRKLEFERRERAKIRERVRRANEIEEAKSKSMDKTKAKRGCCGLFGI
ncbi:hypothetical protein CC78DRAFT_548897 [Lojkania enalia]|uniref:Uncharacterized protein n=1 Tax=Lojkania enalia TaxID=147567 RepID=A0A9P4K132_9PLEO|nr:hypothetical protein CC78DRAFT_548897 [Didymosphaeria enalia]